MADKKAHLTIDGINDPIELPVYSGTMGPDTVDVSSLAGQGIFTYDPGFMSTAACQSAITYIDGDKGVLLYRGYPIEDLASQASHLETCYLLLNGELPNQAQRDHFIEEVLANRHVDSSIGNLINSFDRQAHPMAILGSCISALAAQYHDNLNIEDPQQRYQTAINLIAKFPTLAAMIYRHSIGKAFIAPDTRLQYAENFLYMMSGEKVSETLSRAMGRIFLLHADHEQNASTSTVRLAGSSGTNPYAAIAAGVATLWGPSHGGANEAVLRMLMEIGEAEKIPEFVERAKSKDDPFRLMGFGHRVYKNFDPRSREIKKCCDEVFDELKVNDPLLRVAQQLEKIALEDEYFIEKKLYPNVDFYSGILPKTLGIPVEMFTVIFALGRTPGWITHWNEMLSEPYKIGRPRQLYTGSAKRKFIPLNERK